MISKAISVTKNYLQWAFALAIKHPPVFLSFLASLITAAVVAYYFSKDRDSSFKLAHDYLTKPLKSLQRDKKHLPKEVRIISQTQKTGFLGLREEQQCWVLLYWNYKTPPAEDWVIHEIRAFQSDFRSCGVKHIYLEIPHNKPDEIVVACLISHINRPHFDPDSCRDVLARIAGASASISPVKLIKGPLRQIEGAVIDAF
jgi:hypothetical protein